MKKLKLGMDTAIDLHGKSDMENGWEFLMFLLKNNILFEVLEWVGPGGGWPLIAYIGTEESLRLMLKEKFSCDESDINFHIGGAETIEE